MTRLALHLQRMTERPPTARDILLELIETGDIEISPSGRALITFAPSAAILEALMVFDAGAREREDERIREETAEFYGSGCPMGGAA